MNSSTSTTSHIYTGFWLRVLCLFLDLLLFNIVGLIGLLVGVSLLPSPISGNQSLEALVYFFVAFQVVFLPWALLAVSWCVLGSTPAKLLFNIRIIDEQSGKKPSVIQAINRGIGMFVMFLVPIPMNLGLLWVAFDKRKQGWHDKLFGTLVVRDSNEIGRCITNASMGARPASDSEDL